MYGMATKKTTIYLPDALKRRLERCARREAASEAELIRRAVGDLLDRLERPRPTIPLFSGGGGRSVAEDVDRHLDGFGGA